MDGLISLLIVIGIAAFSSSRKKKQAAKKKAAAPRASAQTEAPDVEGTPRQPDSRNWIEEIDDEITGEPAEALPLLKRIEAGKARARAAAPASKAPPLTRQPLPERAPVEISVSRGPRDDDPEGSVSTQGLHSTQGESREEHAEHVRRVAREEQLRADAHEALREARSMNLKKLRSAVVMSEILGKPVSLRPRSYR